MGWPRNGLHRYDAGPQITRRFLVIAHGNTTLNVVYTNEESTLNETLQMFEHLLEDPKQRRSVGAISCVRLELIVLFCIIDLSMHISMYFLQR